MLAVWQSSVQGCDTLTANCKLITEMLYYLFTWLGQKFDLTGAGLFQYITFRAAMAIVLSLFIATVYGKRLINFLKHNQIGETVRELGLAGEQQKKGTPTMGGIIILL